MTDDVYKIDAQHAGRELTDAEQDAAVNAIKSSQHVSLQVLPNHSMDENGELQGFVFSCPDSESCATLPLHRQTMHMTTVYECHSAGENSTFNADAVRMTSNLPQFHDILSCLAEELRETDMPRAGFHCIPMQYMQPNMQYDNAHEPYVDQSFWEPSMPSRMGVYHTFSRSHGQDTRQHKTFIVVSGCEWHAAEELFTLWQDFSDQYTAKQFCESEELLWLRTATLRSQQRVAARIAERCGLSLPLTVDMQCPHKSMIATHVMQTYRHDLMYQPDLDRVLLSNNASFVARSQNGILFDMFSSEGLWLFCGPADHASYNAYGDLFRHVAGVDAFPTGTVKFHPRYPSSKKYHTVFQALQSQDNCNGVEEIDYNSETAMLCKRILRELLHESADSEDNTDNTDNTEGAENTDNKQDQDKNDDTDSVRQEPNDSVSIDIQPPSFSAAHRYNGIVYSNVDAHRGSYLFPNEQFLQCLQQLGFDRNDGIVVLMPLCVYMHDEKSI